MARATVVWVIQHRVTKEFYAPTAWRGIIILNPDLRKAVKFATRASARMVMRHIFAEGTVSAVERTVG